MSIADNQYFAMPYLLKVRQKTVFKQAIEQSSELPDCKLYPIDADAEPLSLAALIRDDETKKNHVKFTLADGKHLNNLNTWYAYAPHIEIIERVPRKPETRLITNLERERTERGPRITVPGVGKVYLYDPVGKSKNFFWYELTRNGERIPRSAESARGMIRIAEQAQIARDRVGKPFMLTSGYRPYDINLSVGGVVNSRHTDHRADAMDLYWPGANKYQMYDFLDSWWPGGLGIYSHNAIVHIDARRYRARWGRR